jgi:TonB family protein
MNSPIFAHLLRRMLPMPLIAVALASAPAWAAICDSPDAPKVYPWTDPSTHARPLRVLPPEYPTAQFKKGITAKVEATLRINPGGTVNEVLNLKADNGDAAFENAVREAVQHWTFTPYIDCECKPVEFTSRQTVWFEIKGGQPAISVSRGENPPAHFTHVKPLSFLNAEEVFKAASANYPRAARRASGEGVVYALSTIDPATGNVEKVDIQYVVGASEHKPHFARVAASALSLARYQVSEGDKPPIQTCITVEFRLQK